MLLEINALFLIPHSIIISVWVSCYEYERVVRIIHGIARSLMFQEWVWNSVLKAMTKESASFLV